MTSHESQQWFGYESQPTSDGPDGWPAVCRVPKEAEITPRPKRQQGGEDVVNLLGPYRVPEGAKLTSKPNLTSKQALSLD